MPEFLLLAVAALACDPAPRDAPVPAGSPVDAAAPAPSQDERAPVVFLGTSLTAGLGVDVDEAYPARVQAKIDSAGLPYRVVNAGVSGETSAG